MTESCLAGKSSRSTVTLPEFQNVMLAATDADSALISTLPWIGSGDLNDRMLVVAH
jgi:hypothetical protein